MQRRSARRKRWVSKTDQAIILHLLLQQVTKIRSGKKRKADCRALSKMEPSYKITANSNCGCEQSFPQQFSVALPKKTNAHIHIYIGVRLFLTSDCANKRHRRTHLFTHQLVHAPPSLPLDISDYIVFYMSFVIIIGIIILRACILYC